MLEVGFCQAEIAASPQAEAPDGLRNGAFYPGSLGILLLPSIGLLELTNLLESQVLRLGAKSKQAGGVLAASTEGAGGTGTTVPLGKANVNDVATMVIQRWSPPGGSCASGTGDGFGLPVNLKVLAGKTGLLLGLPLIVAANRAKQANLVLGLTLYQMVGVNIAQIHQMGAG